jgi:D-alanyl-D-alanine carboxypeptidase
MKAIKELSTFVALLSFACGPAGESDPGANVGDPEAEDVSEVSQALVSNTIKQTNIEPEATLEAGDRFGSALASGDFDNDNFPDLVVTAPYEDQGVVDAGWVGIMYGGPNGSLGARTEWFTQNSIAGTSRHEGDQLGFAVAVGDFDRDGDDDLAVSMPNYPTNNLDNAGLVAIMNGGPNGLVPGNAITLSLDKIESQTVNRDDQFGYSLAVGRFDEDAFDDLAVGVPGKDFSGAPSAGMVIIYYGRTGGINPTQAENVSENSVAGTARAQGDRFGAALAAGRFDNDLIDDLAVGIPGKKVNDQPESGMVAILHGSNQGLFPTRSQILEQQLLPNASAEAVDHFGASLAVGNFNADGFEDLAIGAPQENLGDLSDSGAVGVVFGSPTGLLPAGAQFFTKQTAGIRRTSFENFGMRLTTGDINGDRISDLIVGAPNDDVDNDNAGAVYVFNGDRAAPLSRSELISQKTFEGVNQANAGFGKAILAQDFDRDGVAELVVGAPHLNEIGGTADVGRVWVKSLQQVAAGFAADAGVVIDRASGRVLAGKNSHYRLPMASTTKMMTALLAVEALGRGDVAANTTVTISNNAATTGGSGVPLQGGDKISFEDLLFMLMLPSTNSAAVAIGEHLAGTEAAWVTRMNQRAADLLLRDTRFANAHGRDPEDMNPALCSGSVFDTSQCAHYSSAIDLARLARFALNNATFARVVRTKQYTTTTWRRNGVDVDTTACNTNRTLPDPAGQNTGCGVDTVPGLRSYGVKTGTTDEAGECLVGAFEDSAAVTPGAPLRNFISVVLGSNARYADTDALMAGVLAQ